MKQTIFRKVYTKDGLPKDNNSLYNTNYGDMYGDDIDINTCDWFLEEIELPSEEELFSEADEHSWFQDWSAEENIAHNTGFMVGANYILNHINSKIKE